MWKTLIFFLTLMLLIPAFPAGSENQPKRDPAAALEEARQALEAKNSTEALRILEPHLGGDLNNPVDWEITAEAGRAAFEAGKLEQARTLLRQAVSARPSVPETAVYLEAASYLLGDRRQALMIFEALLKSGAPDLYLAVSLPGEVRFLTDPDVRALLKKYAKPLDIRPDRGELLGLHLGQARAEITAALKIPPSEDRVLMARAGPELILLFSFDELGMLDEAVLHADHLQRYTAYKLELHPPGPTTGSTSLGWDTHPENAIEVLGPPEAQSREVDGALKIRWSWPDSLLELIFEGVPGSDFSKGHLQLIRLTRKKGPG